MRMLAAAGVFSALLFAALPASANGDFPRAEDRILSFSGQLPACDDPGVLHRIANRFAYREAHFWNSPLTIERFERMRDVAYRPWGASFIPRRYCAAVSLASDGRKRAVYYSVREALGPIGIGNDVQWCVTGLDRNKVFAPDCRAALP